VLDFLKRDLPLEIEEDEEFEIAMQGKLAHAHIRSYAGFVRPSTACV
jgi:hypothetical protein